MTIRDMTHHSTDPEPPVGTVLQGGSPAGGDRVTLQRLSTGWRVAYGGGPFAPCTYEVVLFWCPLRIVARPPQHWSPPPSRRPWMHDLEESA